MGIIIKAILILILSTWCGVLISEVYENVILKLLYAIILGSLIGIIIIFDNIWKLIEKRKSRD